MFTLINIPTVGLQISNTYNNLKKSIHFSIFLTGSMYRDFPTYSWSHLFIHIKQNVFQNFPELFHLSDFEFDGLGSGIVHGIETVP